MNHILDGMSACSSWRRVCHHRKAHIRRTDTIRGARTLAVPQPTVGASDNEKIIKMREAGERKSVQVVLARNFNNGSYIPVSRNTPGASIFLSLFFIRILSTGMIKMAESDNGTAAQAIAQNTQRHEANFTMTPPSTKPRHSPTVPAAAKLISR